MFPGKPLVQSVLSKYSCQRNKRASVLNSAGQSLIDLPVSLHQHLEEFEERDFDLSADLEHYSSFALS